LIGWEIHTPKKSKNLNSNPIFLDALIQNSAEITCFIENILKNYKKLIQLNFGFFDFTIKIQCKKPNQYWVRTSESVSKFLLLFKITPEYL